jgi:hypothetical protein
MEDRQLNSLCGSEYCKTEATGKNKMFSVQKSCLRSVRGCARLDYIMNEDINKELTIQSTEDKTN